MDSHDFMAKGLDRKEWAMNIPAYAEIRDGESIGKALRRFKRLLLVAEALSEELNRDIHLWFCLER